jgi:hypothetical protein
MTMITGILPMIGAILLQYLSHNADPDTSQTAMTALAGVGTAAMVASTQLPSWLGIVRTIFEGGLKIVDILAFNVGRAQNAHAVDDNQSGDGK